MQNVNVDVIEQKSKFVLLSYGPIG